MNVSVWEKESFYENCDLLIAGAGLLGLWTAREVKIKQPQLKVTLIDKSPVPCGASTRNAGFACFGSPSEMIHDLGVMGADAMWQVVEMRYKGIQKILGIFNNDQTGYEPLGGYECYLPEQADKGFLFEKLNEINAGMQAITGHANSFTDASAKLTDYGLEGFDLMLENKYEGGIHSGRYVESLTEYVRSLGVRVLHGIGFQQYETSANEVIVITDQPVIFKSRAMLLATNAWLQQQVPSLGVVPARGQVIVSPPIDNLQLRGTFHFDEGFYYFRNLGNRVLLGGARNSDIAGEQTLALDTTDHIQNMLFDFVTRHIPQAASFKKEMYHSWSGLMAMHPKKLPVMQSIGEHVWAAMCCNGMGVALSPVFAEQVADSIINGIN